MSRLKGTWYKSRLKYRAWQPRATLTLPSTVLRRFVYNAVFTARHVAYFNCDLGVGGGDQCSWQIPVGCAASILPGTRTLLYISDQK